MVRPSSCIVKGGILSSRRYLPTYLQRESSGYTLDVLKDRLRGGDEYVMSDAVVPNCPCNVSNPDVVSESGLSELTSSIHADDKTEHDAFFVQTCVEEVENADYAAPQKLHPP